MNNYTTYKKIVKILPEYVTKKLPEEVKVISIEEGESKTLNTRYRGKRHATNVLSFYYDKTYGEILVCESVIRREAKIAAHSYAFQMTWMIVHGMIHLSGLHHERSAVFAQRAATLEKRILNNFFGGDKR